MNHNMNMMPPPINKKYKTQYCRHVLAGRVCQLGSNCLFAHSFEELRSSPEATPMQQQAPQIMKPQGMSNFKTLPCKYFQQGYCKNGMECTFAHGDMDLRQGHPQQQQQQMGSNYNPMMYEQQMMMQQISSQQTKYQAIFQKMDDMFKNDQIVQDKLLFALDRLTQNDFYSCNQIILDIINDPRRTQEETEEINSIIDKASELEAMNGMNGQPMYMPPYPPQQDDQFSQNPPSQNSGYFPQNPQQMMGGQFNIQSMDPNMMQQQNNFMNQPNMNHVPQQNQQQMQLPIQPQQIVQGNGEIGQLNMDDWD